MKPSYLLGLLPLFGAGCTTDDTPRWAFDIVYLEIDESTVEGFITWEVFSRRWTKRQAAKHYLCAVVVEVEGSVDTGELCTGCSDAWTLTSTVADTDCAEGTEELELFTSPTGLAIGAVSNELADQMPLAGINAGSYISYNNEDWQTHGWVLEPDYASPWAGGDELSLWPAFAWDLEGL
jgi:hypothetical protein